MLSPYRIPNTHTRKQNSSDYDHTWTSRELKLAVIDENNKTVFKKIISKNNLKGGVPNDVNPRNGRDLIERTFFPING